MFEGKVRQELTKGTLVQRTVNKHKKKKRRWKEEAKRRGSNKLWHYN